ncbi:MAG TPA: hypothetical protein VNQ73_11315 [Ilumatobacter sp.]|nr:hypothetical protein [Ilumatobacter sp.]
MSTGGWLVVVLGAAAALAVVLWFLTTRKTPENSPGRSVIADRPAGPDAEAQRVDERGTLETGPVPPVDRPDG